LIHLYKILFLDPISHQSENEEDNTNTDPYYVHYQGLDDQEDVKLEENMDSHFVYQHGEESDEEDVKQSSASRA